ncbi:PREDICTED: KH domain-containing protein At4g18375 [Tarenaya hassleriana]|uniref:KH domain-containing protein At4g18375 n=1 Tax=Tarenaya hassleriana TaxID=28532 RepID=UPI00053C9134|nr:PREDICTED: KH domain-containing protein At4g18375 [Tarenaya hassleriana]
MERSRSKRNYYYDQDYDGDSMGRTKPRYSRMTLGHCHHFGGGGGGGNGRYRGGGGGGNGRLSKPQPDSMVTTTYRILCLDAKAGGVIGKSGSIIKSIRQHTGAWINVHELVPGDTERIIEISDTRRRDPDGRVPSFSPAQEALFLIHDRILESDAQYGYGGPPEEEDYGGVRPGVGRVVTRLVVSRMHVGCLLGKGGKIIEQMRIETKTHIRILPRDVNLPRCVSVSEEIVQVVGETHAVKNALAAISSRLRESQHRDRSHFHGRAHSPERPFPPVDDYIPQQRQQSMDRFPDSNYRNNNFGSRQSNYATETPSLPIGENAQPFYNEELVFRILCPVDKVVRVVGESQGIIDLLQNEIGVDIRVSDPIAGSDEQIITISSYEAPDDELFPAQEALLHIQTRIVDLIPDKENFITTRLLVPSGDTVCLDGKEGSLIEIRRLTGADIEILPREECPPYVSITDDVVQIVGEIKAARDALVELTLRLRRQMYKEFFQKEETPASTSATGPNDVVALVDAVASTNNINQSREGHTGSNLNLQAIPSAPQYKEAGGSDAAANAMTTESENRDDIGAVNRIPVPLVTRSIFEVVLPEQVVPKLVTKSRNKLAQISELSGANVTLVEDRPEEPEKIIRISGTPEQAERAQSLLQGFILSTQEDDGP